MWSVNVHLCSLHLVGYNSEITVYNPREQFIVIGSHFSQLPPATDQKVLRHSLALILVGSVHALVSECTYDAQYTYPSAITSTATSYYNHHAVLVQVTGCRSELQLLSQYMIFRVNVTVDS